MRFQRYDWDNQCLIPKGTFDVADQCKEECMLDEACLQYIFDSNRKECNISHDARFGESSPGSGLYSDWIFERVEQWRDEQPVCDDETFIYMGPQDEL